MFRILNLLYYNTGTDIHVNKEFQMRSDLQKKTINSIFVLALIIFISMGWQAHRQMQSVIRSDALENHSFAIIRQLDLLLTTVTDAETGQRGYLITGDPGYLKPYHAALARLADTRRELLNMTKDDPAQQKRIDGLDVLIDRKLGALKDNLVLRERQGFEASRVRLVATLDEGKQVMAGIRSLIAESQQSEQQRLLKRSSAKAEEIRYTLGMMQAGAPLRWRCSSWPFSCSIGRTPSGQRPKKRCGPRMRNWKWHVTGTGCRTG